MSPPPSTLIIGAGLSGLLVARELAAAGEPVVILEKSRGFGGRLAVKRVGEATFDSGAQFLTAREPEFAARVQGWSQAGWLTRWPGSEHRWIGVPAMTALPKALASGLDIRREHRALAVCRVNDHWEIAIENHAPLTAARLVLTCPVPQALALLAAGGVTLPPAIHTGLAALTYAPCLALLVTLAGPSAVPAEGLVLGPEPVRWLADNTKKGVAPGVPAAVTIHAGPEFSATHYAAPEPAVTAALLAAIGPQLSAPVVTTALHRWKFAEPQATYPEPSVWLPELALGFAGDAFGGPKIEGAARSGLALAERIRRR
jgi:predicted NAD/FAD-dependent oxidoreductase